MINSIVPRHLKVAHVLGQTLLAFFHVVVPMQLAKFFSREAAASRDVVVILSGAPVDVAISLKVGEGMVSELQGMLCMSANLI
mmetsp:Transcript_20331/g.28377  ORF Transcript_20331/g.28377 Transcript_20331/m.28377 type:complete len:83 (-) Transcript_20331:43-291(-)